MAGDVRLASPAASDLAALEGIGALSRVRRAIRLRSDARRLLVHEGRGQSRSARRAAKSVRRVRLSRLPRGRRARKRAAWKAAPREAKGQRPKA